MPNSELDNDPGPADYTTRMGCASSTPMMNGSGGIVGAAKHAASDVVHAGEDKLNGNKQR